MSVIHDNQFSSALYNHGEIKCIHICEKSRFRIDSFLTTLTHFVTFVSLYFPTGSKVNRTTIRTSRLFKPRVQQYLHFEFKNRDIDNIQTRFDADKNNPRYKIMNNDDTTLSILNKNDDKNGDTNEDTTEFTSQC